MAKENNRNKDNINDAQGKLPGVNFNISNSETANTKGYVGSKDESKSLHFLNEDEQNQISNAIEYSNEVNEDQFEDAVEIARDIRDDLDNRQKSEKDKQRYNNKRDDDEDASSPYEESKEDNNDDVIERTNNSLNSNNIDDENTDNKDEEKIVDQDLDDQDLDDQDLDDQDLDDQDLDDEYLDDEDLDDEDLDDEYLDDEDLDDEYLDDEKSERASSKDDDINENKEEKSSKKSSKDIDEDKKNTDGKDSKDNNTHNDDLDKLKKKKPEKGKKSVTNKNKKEQPEKEKHGDSSKKKKKLRNKVVPPINRKEKKGTLSSDPAGKVVSKTVGRAAGQAISASGVHFPKGKNNSTKKDGKVPSNKKAGGVSPFSGSVSGVNDPYSNKEIIGEKGEKASEVSKKTGTKETVDFNPPRRRQTRNMMEKSPSLNKINEDREKRVNPKKSGYNPMAPTKKTGRNIIILILIVILFLLMIPLMLVGGQSGTPTDSAKKYFSSPSCSLDDSGGVDKRNGVKGGRGVPEGEYSKPVNLGEPGTKDNEGGHNIIGSAYGEMRAEGPHKGLDLPTLGEYKYVGADGSDRTKEYIFNTEDGTVVSTDCKADPSGYGCYLLVMHENESMGRYFSMHGHVYEDELFVNEGDEVAAGQPIAHIGSNGGSSGVHDHFEIRKFSGEAEVGEAGRALFISMETEDPTDYVKNGINSDQMDIEEPSKGSNSNSSKKEEKEEKEEDKTENEEKDKNKDEKKDKNGSSGSQKRNPKMSKSDTAKLIKKVKEPVGVKPYVLGAAGPDAFDCSGLMQWAYKSIGIDIPRTTFDQKDAGEIIWDRSKDGGEIPEDKLKPGDLILFDGFGHVAMYTGDGMVSNAATDGVPLENQIEYEPIANAGTTPERVVRIDDAIANGSVDGDSSSDENKTTDSSYENCFCESGETAASEYEDTNGESSASPHEFYEKNAKFIIKEARNKGLSNEQTALALAIADANSGLANVANKSKKGNEKVPGDRIARSVEHNPEGDTEDEAGRMGLFFLIPGEHGEVKELMDKKYSTEYVFNKIASIEGLTSDNWDEKVEPLGLHLKNKPSKSQKIANELLENNGITNSMKKEKEDKKKDKKSNRRQGGSHNGSNSKAYEKRGVKLPDPSPYNPEGVKAYEKLKGVYGPGLPDAADWYRVAMYESTDNVNQPPVMAVNEPAGGLYAIPASRWNPVAEKAGVKKVKDSYEIPKRSREEQTKIAVEMWKEVGWMYWGTVYGTPEQKAAGLAPHANQAEGGPGHGVELNTMNAISWDGKAKANPGSSEGSDDDQFGDDSYECSSDNDSDSDSVGKGTGKLNSDGIPEEYVKLIEDAASETKNIDPASLAAILSIESGFNPKASSGVAHGIAQFTPDTWASKGNGGDIWDPKDAIPASARFLDELYDNAEKEIEKNGGKGDDPLELMAASYNGGPGSIQAGACGTPARVPKCGDPNNFSSYAGQTAPYVEKFMKEREKFSK